MTILQDFKERFLTFEIVRGIFWGDPAERLQTKSLSVSYFPDKSDKEIIRSLSERDGRVFADEEPLPKFSEPDPDFKGNKWIPLGGRLNK